MGVDQNRAVPRRPRAGEFRAWLVGEASRRAVAEAPAPAVSARNGNIPVDADYRRLLRCLAIIEAGLEIFG